MPGGAFLVGQWGSNASTVPFNGDTAGDQHYVDTALSAASVAQNCHAWKGVVSGRGITPTCP